MSDTQPIATVEDLSYGYPPAGLARPVLESVNLTIEADDFLGIIGPNGGGKTTLLKILLGLIRPQRGRVRVLGRDPKKVSARIGYVPQHAQIDTSVPATVLDVVLMGRLAAAPFGLTFGGGDRQLAHEALARTDVADLAPRGIGDLSGGQRQRVLIARALASDAELLLLDEPTAGVDAQAERAFVELLHELNDSLPIVLVSHDVSFVTTHLKRVACLNRRLTVHRADEVTDDVLAGMYHDDVRAVHHHDDCPLSDPGCGHGCEPRHGGAGVEPATGKAEGA